MNAQKVSCAVCSNPVKEYILLTVLRGQVVNANHYFVSERVGYANIAVTNVELTLLGEASIIPQYVAYRKISDK